MESGELKEQAITTEDRVKEVLKGKEKTLTTADSSVHSLSDEDVVTEGNDLGQDAPSCSSLYEEFHYDREKGKPLVDDPITGAPNREKMDYNDFLRAVMHGDIETVKKQVELGVYPDSQSDDGYSPLVIAILEGHIDVLKFLLDVGADADVNSRNRSLPPLVHALMITRTGPEMMQLLLDRGAILNAISGPDQKNALHWAVSEGKAEAVEFLLEKGLDIEAKCSRERTPLILAAEAGHTHIAKVLCAKGASLDARSKNGGTCLTWAACNNKVDVLKFLLEQEVDIEAKDSNGHSKSSTVLYKNSGDASSSRNCGDCVLTFAALLYFNKCSEANVKIAALSLASHFGYKDIVELLLAHDADINTLSKLPNNCTPVMAAACSNRIEVLKTLIAHGCDLTVLSAHGNNVLEIAIRERQIESAKILLEAFGGEGYPKESVALEIALANEHAMLMGIMNTASVMYSYMEVSLRGPAKFAWMEWVLSQGGNLLKPLAMANMLHLALQEFDLPMISALAHHGCDMNRRLESGHTPLSFAVGHRKLEMVQVLLDAGADPNMEIPDRDGMNYTPFDHAIIELENGKDTEIVDLLLCSGRCRINKGRDPGATAFSYILGKSRRWAPGVADELALRMIDSIPDVNQDKDDIGCTPLHVAVYHKRPDMIEHLLNRGANIEAKAVFGYTPLIIACQHNTSMIPFLMEKGANVHAKYKSNAGALHAAAADGNVEALEFLIGLGLDVDMNTHAPRGYTPLACALTLGQEKAALTLLKHGADATCVTLQLSQTALHCAAKNGLKAAVVEILKQPVELNARDKQGWTPLHDACASDTSGTLDVVAALLDAGADLELPLPNGDHPLHMALLSENEDLALFLIERGASISSLASKSRTALHIAADFNLPRATRALLEAGHPTEGIDADTWTPLCCANEHYIALQLIQHGADINYADRDGWTPLHQAVYNRDRRVARLLVLEGADVHARTTDDGLTVLERADDVEFWDEEWKVKVEGWEVRSWVTERRRNVRDEERARIQEKIEKVREEDRERLRIWAKEEEEKRMEEEDEALEGLGGRFEIVDVVEE
ncbi:ankyrin [Byssothecium circinans]|uniref:Ankyrin n=1 Tax=Byssothecium circinans TaxID=147558 RepID=A0A6A5TNK8_9PLEO|nr:ankyrin [Byssothecium circinans]